MNESIGVRTQAECWVSGILGLVSGRAHHSEGTSPDIEDSTPKAASRIHPKTSHPGAFDTAGLLISRSVSRKTLSEVATGTFREWD